jgi:peptide deformylase
MRKLIYYPDPRLRQVCAPVLDAEIPEMQSVFDELIEACLVYDGVAIAAPQVGCFRRAIVINFEKPLVLINPEIVWKSEETHVDREGCLSFPNITVHVERPEEVKFDYTDQTGKRVREKTFSELYARALCHETEHLDGVLLIDHANGRLQRSVIEKKMRLWKHRNG